MESIKNTIWYIFIRFWNRTFSVCVKLLISLSFSQTPNPTPRSVLFHSLSVSTTARHRRLPDIAFWRQWTPVQPSRAYRLGSRALLPPAFRSPCRRWNTYTDFGPGGNCRVIKVPFMASTPVRYGTARNIADCKKPLGAAGRATPCESAAGAVAGYWRSVGWRSRMPVTCQGCLLATTKPTNPQPFADKA